MLFGKKHRFAIEVSDPIALEEGGELYCHFRFWFGGTAVGDWDEYIMLHTSVEYMFLFQHRSGERLRPDLADLPAKEIFDKLYHFFYEMDAETCPTSRDWLLRAIYQMDDIGMSSIVDKYGIILVSRDFRSENLIWISWANKEVVNEFRVCSGEVERASESFVNWGRQKIKYANYK